MCHPQTVSEVTWLGRQFDYSIRTYLRTYLQNSQRHYLVCGSKVTECKAEFLKCLSHTQYLKHKTQAIATTENFPPEKHSCFTNRFSYLTVLVGG